MPEPEELNEVLQDRKILSVEPGSTPGWMIVDLQLRPEEREAQPDLRLFLTVFVGGRKGASEGNHYSTCALHYKDADGSSGVYAIRDERDPEMPMASAYKVLGETRVGPKSEPSNLGDLMPEESALQGPKAQKESSKDLIEEIVPGTHPATQGPADPGPPEK